jgi:hypothetical protein
MENRIDIKKLSLVELKSIAYDIGKQFEIARMNLQVINKEIEVRETPIQEEIKEECCFKIFN